MNKLYAIVTIIAPDIKAQKNYILSISNNKIALPIFNIESAEFLHNELRYNIKKMFSKDIRDIIENIKFSYVEIQNDLALSYIKDININDFYTKDDLFLLTGIILDKKYTSDFFWNEFKFRANKVATIIDNIIDFTIQKSIL